MSNWDDNDLESVSEENLRYFYEEFSASVRKQLLAKNLLVPQNVYDVLYPRERQALMAKNISTITDLEENSKTIRDALIAKLVSEGTDIEKMSEDTRRGLLARNKILQEANDLLNDSNSARKSLLSKNRIDEGDLLKDSESIRRNNISKNDENISAIKNTDSNNEEFRLNNLSKNTPSSGNLEVDSADFRKNNISSNVSESNKGLDVESQSFRDDNLSKNKTTNRETIESVGAVQRNLNQSKNNPTDETVDKTLESAETFRDKNISLNTPAVNTIDTNSDSFRNQNISNNTESSSDLQKDSEAFLKKNEANNTSKISDIESSSTTFRDNLISANKSDSGDLLNDSVDFLTNNISANKPGASDLLNDSDVYLKNNISNNKKDSGDLEKDSEEFRKNNISSNKIGTGDLLVDSDIFLKNNTSANKPDAGDLLTDSATFLGNNTSANVPSTSDLLADSTTFLGNNVSANKPSEGDLLDDSKAILQSNMSANKPDSGDLLADSATFLGNNTSANVPSTSDLLADSEDFFANNTSVNVQNVSDLLDDSENFFANNISANVPSTSDLLADSESFLNNNTAPNVPNASDLLVDSESFLNNNIAPNVPGSGDLLTDSNAFLANNTAPNVPDTGDLLTDSNAFLANNTAPNVPDTGDLLVDSNSYLNSNLVSNVPNTGDLLTDSSEARNILVSSNVPHVVNLETFSKPFRDNNLASNPPVNSLGIIIEGIGTSTFLGVSRVLTQGIILRQVLKSKNKPSKYNIDNFVSISTLDKTNSTDSKNLLISKNEFQLGKTEYAQLNANLVKGAGTSFFGDITKEQIQKQLDRNSFYNRSVALNLQGKYGSNFEDATSPASIGGGFYSLDSVGPKGGTFDGENAPNQVSFDVRYSKGSITDAIRNYNLSRNLYNLYKLTPGDLQSLNALQQNNDEGFQDLIAKTIGHLSANNSVGSQLQGNLVPRGILVANEGSYIKGGSPENILRPEQPQGMVIGTAASMMAQTVPGNPLMDTEFQAGTKGVKHIMRTIRNGEVATVGFAGNYDVQNERKYIIGTNGDGTPKVARQRFTIANPYRPGNAKTLLFSLQNYSSGAEFFFPPYIQSYSDSYGASWNSVNFLGRPEPVFTYNNSTRDGTISFIVLTDYTQNLIIGTDYNSDSMSDVKINPRVHFTSKDAAQNAQKEISQNSNPQREAKKKEISDTIKEKETHKGLTSGGTPELNVIDVDIENLKKDRNSLDKEINNSFIESNAGTVYSETNNVIGNINTFMTTVPGRDAGDIDTKAVDSKKRIDQMIQNLAFQPAFFSGDKLDFRTKMDFLAKMTRPAKADEGSGFSFTRPPVCHIHLGDWWNNDIVVDSVNFSYDDVPWTLDEGEVQPMWAVVNMTFKFVGPYRGQQGGPVLSDDKGGFYFNRTNS